VTVKLKDGREVPNPGSPEAIALGCICPVIDNGHGKGSGYLLPDGSPEFWYRTDCTVHEAPTLFDMDEWAKREPVDRRNL